MQELRELGRHGSPAGRPQPLVFHGANLWVGCWDTSQLYEVDVKTWSVRQTVPLPGQPYGMASLGGALRVVVSLGDDDDRYIYRYVPGERLRDDGRIECPEFTGSHLTSDGSSLYLVQQTNQRLLELSGDGSLRRAIPLPSRCAGICFDGKTCSIISADAEFDVLEFATLDLTHDEPPLVPLAPMDVEARGLAFDGHAWWTCYRELNEIVAFAVAREDAHA